MRLNRRVSIWKHARLADGKRRYCRPVLDAKGKIVPDMVIINGVEERHAEGVYYICFYNPALVWPIISWRKNSGCHVRCAAKAKSTQPDEPDELKRKSGA